MGSIISYKSVIDDNNILHYYEYIQDAATGHTQATDLLPTIRKAFAKHGYDDFTFGLDFYGSFSPDMGKKYVECNDPHKLNFEWIHGLYRSLDAKKMLEDLLTNKFGYHYIDYGNGSAAFISDKDYKQCQKIEEKKEEFIKKINSGEKVVVRINEEIHNLFKVHQTSFATCKDIRGISLNLVFDENKIKFKPYSNNKHYAHILDENGNIIKTRNHYCIISCHYEGDKYNYFGANSFKVIVDSIQLQK